MTVDRIFSAASLGSPRVFLREKPAISSLLTSETFSMPSPPAKKTQRLGQDRPTERWSSNSVWVRVPESQLIRCLVLRQGRWPRHKSQFVAA